MEEKINTEIYEQMVFTEFTLVFEGVEVLCHSLVLSHAAEGHLHPLDHPHLQDLIPLDHLTPSTLSIPLFLCTPSVPLQYPPQVETLITALYDELPW